ncbi:MAG: hypothetical protein UV38_C0001G0025 [candidate division TM6 bacterium GW2011_GWE2_42_60]|nr:MAG: hypothetical protein UV38_C0001G0025 [candidate division TM6 bacterium GW2011_GWE2_42_60]HBY05779.1 hypothetical protein [Candidatus Dependentiae bacterium]
MKKILVSFVALLLCGLAQGANNGAEKIESKEIFSKKSFELNIPGIIQKLEEKDQTLLLDVFIDRIKFFILVLTRNHAIDDVFDKGCYKIQKRIKKKLALLSADALMALDQIDVLTNKTSPHYNMKLINSYMELCSDVAKKLERTQNKKIKEIFKNCATADSALSRAAAKSSFYMLKAAPLNDQGKFDFDLVVTASSKEFKKQMMYEKLKKTKMLELVMTTIEKSETPEIIQFIKGTQEYKDAKEAFDFLAKNYENFEESLTASVEQWVPMLDLYSSVITTLCSFLHKHSQKVILILKDLCLIGGKDNNDLNKVQLNLDNLNVLKALLTNTVKNTKGALDLPLDRVMYKLLLSNLVKQTPGLFFLFWGGFIEDIPSDYIGDIDSIVPTTDRDFAVKINQNHYLVDFIDFLIDCLDEKEIKLLSQTDSVPVKKVNKTIKQELVFSKNTGHHKNIFHKKPYQEKSDTCFSGIEKNENTTTTTTTTTSTSCASSPQETEIKIQENKRDSALDMVVKKVRRFLKKRSSDFFEFDKKSVLRVRSSNFFNAFIVSQKNDENTMTIVPKSIDFSDAKDCDGFHKAAILAFKNENILKQCSFFNIQKTDDNTLKSLSKDFKITFQKNTAFVALLPCFIKLTRCDAKKTFKDICKKLSQRQNFNTDILGLGNHTGALVMLLENHRFSEQTGLSWYCSHLFFHEDAETKLFHQNYKNKDFKNT